MDTPIVHIQIDEDGTARTINKRVKVKMIAQKHYTAGETVADIAAHYGIDLADVHAALAYYHDNRATYEQQAQALTPDIQAGQVRTADLKQRIQARMQQDDEA